MPYARIKDDYGRTVGYVVLTHDLNIAGRIQRDPVVTRENQQAGLTDKTDQPEWTAHHSNNQPILGADRMPQHYPTRAEAAQALTKLLERDPDQDTPGR